LDLVSIFLILFIYLLRGVEDSKQLALDIFILLVVRIVDPGHSFHKVEALIVFFQDDLELMLIKRSFLIDDRVIRDLIWLYFDPSDLLYVGERDSN